MAIIGATILTAVLISHATTTDTDKRIYDKVASKTYRMLNPDNTASGGTGFLIKAPSGKTYMMTNAHVCSMSDKTYVLAEQGGRLRRVNIIEIDQDADLCILQGITGETGLSTGPRNISLSEKLFIVGHPYLNPTTLTDGFYNELGVAAVSYCERLRYLPNTYNILPKVSPRANDADPFEFLFDCIKYRISYFTNANSAPGNSGSAVTNSNGDVVGVLYAGNGRGVSVVVTSYQLQDFLAGY